MDFESTLTRRGLLINKNCIKNKIINRIKRELTVKPKTMQDFNTDNIKAFKVYKTIDEKILCLPRYYGEKIFGQPTITQPFNSQPINLIFNGSLRPLQNEVVEKVLNHVKENGGGLISLPCGYGKTVIALNIAVKLGVKTLVIVHKTFLQNQWYERIKHFTNARIGMIRQKKTDVANKDIVVGMLQSISMIDYDQSIFDDFGLVIFDEVHHVGSRIFSRALFKTGAQYTIGLSATPTRSDGLTKVIKWHLGKMIHKVEREGCKYVAIRILEFNSNDQKFQPKQMWFNKKMRPAVQKMINNITELQSRNDLIINTIKELVINQRDRKLLLLSGRLKHLELLKTSIDKIIQEKVAIEELEQDEIKTAYYIGGMKEYQMDDASEADIIFATYAMAEEGLDIVDLNTLIFATPKSSITQSIGRILRKQIESGDIPPLVVDISDNLSSFPFQAQKRLNHYHQNDYRIKTYKTFDENIVNELQYKSISENKTQNEIISKYPEFGKYIDQNITLKQVFDTNHNDEDEDEDKNNDNDDNEDFFFAEF
jgi:superfamily II DNA or RNA helicase